MKMSDKVTITESSMVRPAMEIPRRTLWLSCLDFVASNGYIFTLYAYNPINNIKSSFFDANILKESLSKVLVPFYPIAGRLKKDTNGRLEVDCNSEGALFIEAKTSYKLADFGEFKPTPEVKSLLAPPPFDNSKGYDSMPLLMVQLTRFSCGGVTLGMAEHHGVLDGYAGSHLLSSWARIAKGLELEIVPFHERKPYLLPRNPPQDDPLVKFHHSVYYPPKETSGNIEPKADHGKETTTSIFSITGDQIRALKQKATSSESNDKLTTFEVLAAHILQTTCKARELADEQEVKLFIPLDGRHRLKNPALPQGFIGNVIFIPFHIARSGEITTKPLGFVASKIHETLEKVTNEDYLRSTIDFYETVNINELINGVYVYGYPNIFINSWIRFPFYEVDFGWGKPFIAGRPMELTEGILCLAPTSDSDGGISLMITLVSEHMVLFEKYFNDI